MDPKQISFLHETPIQIRFNDIDGLGHVNNSIYGCYFDLGRMKYFESVYQEPINWNNPGLIIKKTEIIFEKPSFIDDEICVRSKVSRLGNKSFEMIQVVADIKSGDIKAYCTTVLVAIDSKSNTTIKIPEELRLKIEMFEGLNSVHNE